MAKYTVELDSIEVRTIFDAMAVRLAQSQRAVKVARSDAVSVALQKECADITGLVTKLTKAFAV